MVARNDYCFICCSNCRYGLRIGVSDMTKHGLDSVIKAINKEIEKNKRLLKKTFEEVTYEEMEKTRGYIEGLETSLVIIDQIIELEGGPK